MSKVDVLRKILASFVLVLGIVIGMIACQSQPVQPQTTIKPESSPTAQSQELSTPALIEQAFAKGEVTAGQRLLYLAYAIYEYESLPVRFRSNVGWHGTFVVKEVKDATADPSVMCTLSPEVQSELRRLLKGGVTCNNNN